MKGKLVGASFVMAAALLAGCGGGGYYTNAYVGYGPPPPVAYGLVGVAPGPGFVWINGYYNWAGGRYAWVPGRWVRPPHPGAVWHAPEWRHEGRGWRYHEGRWR
jgi:WXXGXW repeat (2 copies)